MTNKDKHPHKKSSKTDSLMGDEHGTWVVACGEWIDLDVVVKFWNLFHTPNTFRIEDYEPVYCDHEEKTYLAELGEGMELWQCKDCTYLFTKESGEFREPDPKDWEDS